MNGLALDIWSEVCREGPYDDGRVVPAPRADEMSRLVHSAIDIVGGPAELPVRSMIESQLTVAL